MGTRTGQVRAPRVKLEFVIKGLSLSLEADKEDAPHISNSIARQLAGILEPVTAATTSPRRLVLPAPDSDVNGHDDAKPKARKGRRTTGGGASPVAAFAHSAEQWGFPDQKFSTQEKSMYLLFVSEAQGGPKELTAGTIASWFNQHFKSAGSIRPSNVSKYLREGQGVKPALVGEDATKSPSEWYLTTEGRKAAEQLVIKARGVDKV